MSMGWDGMLCQQFSVVPLFPCLNPRQQAGAETGQVQSLQHAITSIRDLHVWTIYIPFVTASRA